MNNIYIMPRTIMNCKSDYEYIILLWNSCKDKKNSKISIDFKNTNIIESNIMALIGMVLTNIHENNNVIYLRNISDTIKRQFIKSGLITSDLATEDIILNSLINYNSLSAEDNDKFRELIMLGLEDDINYEQASLLKNIVMEIFINIKMHARQKENINKFEEKEVFFQKFYNSDKKNIIISIANNGLTFYESIISHRELKLSKQYEYILWSLVKDNSKDEGIGGRGLYKVLKFVEKYEGELVILSGNGFYKFNGNNPQGYEKIDLKYSLSGTVITINIPINNIQPEIKINCKEEYSVSDLITMVT